MGRCLASPGRSDLPASLAGWSIGSEKIFLDSLIPELNRNLLTGLDNSPNLSKGANRRPVLCLVTAKIPSEDLRDGNFKGNKRSRNWYDDWVQGSSVGGAAVGTRREMVGTAAAQKDRPGAAALATSDPSLSLLSDIVISLNVIDIILCRKRFDRKKRETTGTFPVLS